MKKYLLIFATIFFVHCDSFSQSKEGCLIGSSLNQDIFDYGLGHFWYNPYPACNVGGGWSFVSSSGSAYLRSRCTSSGGTYGKYNCPIDDYTPLMIMLAGGTGFFFLRNRFSLV